MDEEDVLRVELEVLRQKHSDLKAEIEALGEGALGNSLALSRMKKQKLALKDQIARIEDRRDRAGFDGPSRFDRHERRSWWRIWGPNQ